LWLSREVSYCRLDGRKFKVSTSKLKPNMELKRESGLPKVGAVKVEKPSRGAISIIL